MLILFRLSTEGVIVGEQTRLPSLEIGTLILDWTSWIPWRDLLVDNRGGAGAESVNLSGAPLGGFY